LVKFDDDTFGGVQIQRFNPLWMPFTIQIGRQNNGSLLHLNFDRTVAKVKEDNKTILISDALESQHIGLNRDGPQFATD